jgi:hypothetical protein
MNALSRIGVPNQPFVPVVGQYGAPFFPQPGAQPTEPQAPMTPPMGALPGAQPIIYSGSMYAGIDPGTVAQYDPIKSPNQTWGGLLDSLAAGITFGIAPAVQALMGIPTFSSFMTGALPGTAFDPTRAYDEIPNMGGIFDTGGGKTPGLSGTDPGGMLGGPGGYTDPNFGFLSEIAANGIPNPAPATPSPGFDPGGSPSADVHGGPSSTDNTGESRRYGGPIAGEGPVPITAHGGEFVMRPEAVQRYGENVMHAINRGDVPRNALSRYAR